MLLYTSYLVVFGIYNLPGIERYDHPLPKPNRFNTEAVLIYAVIEHVGVANKRIDILLSSCLL